MSSFTEKKLRAKLILAGTNQFFPGTNSNTLEVTNIRMSVAIQAVARLSTQAEVRIYGLRKQDMDALSVIWANPPIILNHLVIIEANGTGRADGWSQVFKGTIIEGQPEYDSMPDVPFTLLARTGYFVQIEAAKPTSYPTQVDIGVAASDIIESMGSPWAYIDGGATGVLSNPYFSGTLWDQLAQACVAAKADFYVQGDDIIVVPSGQPRTNVPAVTLSPDSGLQGYPQFERSGLNVVALFDPAFSCGTPLEIKGSVPSANGRWFPYSMEHRLESRTPNGKWHSYMRCLRVLG